MDPVLEATETVRPRTEMEREVEHILEPYEKTPEDTIMVLQDIQAKYNWLPREALEYASARLSVPLAQIYHIGTFYKAFSLKPRGKHILQLCTGTACHVRGSRLILDSLVRDHGLKSGETTADGLLTLECVNCLGACALGPILVVDGKYVGHCTQVRAGNTVKRLRKEADADKKENANA
jgi:NADH-quinone oxidoreductase subunit E